MPKNGAEIGESKQNNAVKLAAKEGIKKIQGSKKQYQKNKIGKLEEMQILNVLLFSAYLQNHLYENNKMESITIIHAKRARTIQSYRNTTSAFCWYQVNEGMVIIRVRTGQKTRNAGLEDEDVMGKSTGNKTEKFVKKSNITKTGN